MLAKMAPKTVNSSLKMLLCTGFISNFMPDFTDINAILPDLAARADDPPANKATQAAVKQALRELFGQSADFLQPYFFASGRLVIFVSAPVWSTHIRHRQNSLIEKLREQHIIANEIEVKVLVQEKSPADSRKQNTHAPISTKTQNQIARVETQLKNPALRESIARLKNRLTEKPQNNEHLD